MATAPPGTIWLVGAGNMGGAMHRGWIASGAADAITVVDTAHPPPADGWPDILVLAVKPQQLAAAATALAGRAGGPRLLLSVLAGVELATLRTLIPAGSVVRAMPNLPAAIGQGVTLLCSDAGPAARADAERLVAPLGLVEWIADEALFDAATALSGCGPGFTFRYIDALADAGVALGLDGAVARRLALATVAGSAAMASASSESPARLADRVASPGGSTREGLNVLDEERGLADLLRRTLAASAARNRTLAAETR